MVGRMKTKGMRKMAKGGTKMMKARGGKTAKGYAKGGTKMMKARVGRMMPDRPIASGAMRKGTMARPMGAMKGKMAKGYAKGGVKKMQVGGGITVAKLRSEAKKRGMKLVKA